MLWCNPGGEGRDGWAGRGWTVGKVGTDGGRRVNRILRGERLGHFFISLVCDTELGDQVLCFAVISVLLISTP